MNFSQNFFFSVVNKMTGYPVILNIRYLVRILGYLDILLAEFPEKSVSYASFT